MSKVTMSAPSSARRTAWDRPCPRAPPLMKATLPSRRPMPITLLWGCSGLEVGLEGLVVVPDAALLVVAQRHARLHRGVQALLHRAEIRHVLLEDDGQAAESGDIVPVVVVPEHHRLRRRR